MPLNLKAGQGAPCLLNVPMHRFYCNYEVYTSYNSVEPLAEVSHVAESRMWVGFDFGLNLRCFGLPSDAKSFILGQEKTEVAIL